MTSAPQTPIPAATLVLFRERAGAAPELLMVERAQTMAFAGGALVFPGGRIDPADHAHAERHIPGSSADWEQPARIAAIREMVEEAGLPVGLSPLPDPQALASIRTGLHAGRPFADLLGNHDLTLDLAALTLFARWCPRHPHMRIFDTLFFLARLPDGSPDPEVDATENTRVFWQSARGVLDDADAGRVSIIFPTRCNLERLAQFASFDVAVEHAGRFPARMVTPWVEERGGAPHLCIPDDLGYPITAVPMEGMRRG
ncbi:MAG: NUDIX hydrolase [Sphingomonas sp.]